MGAAEGSRHEDDAVLWGWGFNLGPRLRSATEDRHLPIIRSATRLLCVQTNCDVDWLTRAAAASRAQHASRSAAGGFSHGHLHAYLVGAALAAIALLRAAGVDKNPERATRLIDTMHEADTSPYLSRWTWPPRRWSAAAAYRQIESLWARVEAVASPLPAWPDEEAVPAAEQGVHLRIVAAPAGEAQWQAQLSLIRASGASYDEASRWWHLTLTEDRLMAGALDPLFRAAAEHRTRVTTELRDE